MASSCATDLDDVWGPVVDDCRRTFDFTLLFEQSILSTLPTAIFLILTFLRIWRLLRREQRLATGVVAAAKVVLVLAVGGLQLALAVLWSRDASTRTRMSIASTVISLLASLTMAPLSWLEHTRTIKPSLLICSFLLLMTLLDMAQVRTLWTLPNANETIASLFTASYAIRTVLLILESLPKKLTREVDIARSPEDKCGVVSRSFFLWLVPLIYAGFRKTLGVGDLYAPPVDAAPSPLEEKLWQGWKKSKPGSKNRLLVVTARALLPRLLSPVIPRLCMVGFMVTTPVLLSRLIAFLDERPESPNHGYGLLGAYALVYIGLAVANAWYFHQTFKFITCVRGGLVAMVYGRTMRLSTSAIDKSSAVTVMSADIERIALGLKTIHDIWANVIQVALAAWLLEKQTGVAIVLPLVVAAACGYGTLKVSGAAGGQQANWLKKIEKRIEVTTRTLSSMRGVKITGLTTKLAGSIQDLRAAELQAAASFRWWQVGALIMGFVPVMINPVLTFAIFIAVAHGKSEPLDASRMFVSLSFLTIMSQPLSMLFQSGPQISSMIACFDRIGKFVETKEREDLRENVGEKAADDIEIRGGKFAWSPDSTPNLQNVDISFPRGKLTMIIGPVGCGKSTLLKGLLGEVPHTQGTVNMPSASVAFCDQTPWIMNGTVKENITKFSSEDEDYYNTVLTACALHEDLVQLSDGDASKVGSKGITLSGGQKQRVSLARALFARRNINLFDDVLSGLDATTATQVFAYVFGPDGILKRNGSTVVLATHAVHFLPYADHIVCIGPGGDIVQQGPFLELNEADGYLRTLDTNSTRAQNLPTFPEFHPIIESPPEKDLESKSTTITEEFAPKTEPGKPHGVYRYYIKSIGHIMAILYVVLAAIYAFLYTFPYIWAKWWTDANAQDPWNRTAYYMGIYAMLQVLCLVSLVIFAWHAVITIVTTSGLSLHQTLLTTALQAPLSFFERTDTGVTLNRFSQDLQMVDNELPLAALNIACSGLILVGQMLLIMNTSYWIALSFPAIILVLWALQSVYLRTSRQLRHLDIETKAPLYSQFVESLDGLASIRAFGWQEPLKVLLYDHLEKSQRPFYLLLVIQRWLSVVLDCLTAGFVLLLLIIVIIGLRHQVSPGFAGVALANLINLSGSLTTVVNVWTQMETSIASIQRIRDFEKDVPSETKGLSKTAVTSDWPSKGEINIQNLVATYKDGAITALRNLTMGIKPGEKIGICGRTGSGKTSLTLALFQMIGIDKGSITIDGVDIAHVDPNILRSSLNGIPQDPYFMAGSVRLNADPNGTKSDEEIMKALTSVHLDHIIKSKGGLDAEMEDGLFSQGEKQLFCLARAILKRSKIVVFDEATSNIDVKTEVLINKVIEEEFKGFTVITIAHRLKSILSSDRIAVLEAGELIEFDSPDVLLSRESRFKALFEAYDKE
ncbi:hypothetical protein QQS21_005133 [Conoideocrella luteorostrata]|uniref:P-loop containing nucleoside triphosphate hydrolase protein n=1 Tax=Conoideocrella luteorostrata TaxID=1105319 RepID=A0AAJ0FU25_9HYPO|nr:hypothetical protein QQS21_005133 [Conoideocrella luteorostrata]